MALDLRPVDQKPEKSRLDLKSLDGSMATLGHSQAFRERINQDNARLKAESDAANNPLNIAKETAKGTVSSLADNAVRFARSAITAPVDLFNMARGKGPDISELPGFSGEGQRTIQGQFAVDAGTNAIEGEKDIGDFGKAVGDTLLGGAEIAGGRAIKQGVDAIAPGVKNAVGRTKSKIGDFFANRAAEKEQKKALDYAIKEVMEVPDEDFIIEQMKRGNFRDAGKLKKGELTPTPKDNQLGESVADVIKPKNKPLANVEAINQKISQTNLGVRNMIAENKQLAGPFNQNQLRSKLAAGKADNELVFASDVTAERTYDAVIDEFMKHTDQMDTLGLFDARQEFDKIPAIKNLLDKAPAGENIRKQIVLDVRKAANEYIADLLPANNPYKKALLEESRMIQALENYVRRYKDRIGSSELEILAKENPGLRQILTFLGVAVGGSVVGGATVQQLSR